MRVGLNLTYLTTDSGGSGRYARELIPSMLIADPALRLTGFISAQAPRDLFEEPWADEVDWVRFSHRPDRPGLLAPLLSMTAQWGAIPAISARRRLQLVHGLANVIPVVAPRLRTVVTVLDLIWLRHAQTMDARATVGMKIVTPHSARSASRVIAISHAVRDDLVATLGIDPDRIDVVHLGVRGAQIAEPTPEALLRRRLELPYGAPVILCVAQLRRHKNPAGLVEALARLETPEVRLVFVGVPTGYEATLRELAERTGIADRVRFAGWVSEADLEGLYRLGQAFVLPSFEEGFGLPVLEAMRRELPVACSEVSSLPEVAGTAALFFDPRDVRAIARAVDRLLGDRELRARLIAAGRERVASFTWEATARATLQSYRRALETR